MSDKIKVAIRVRPLIEREKLEGLPLRWITQGNQIHQIDPATEKIKDVYTFDHIFGASESNSEVFETIVKPIIDASMQGFNGTVFAYGQTSSGKTYTMSGTQKCLGIIPLAINYIFYSIENTPGREFLLRVSYMEIYNEKVNDLLDISKKNLKIQEDYSGQVIVADVEERVCKNSTEVLEEKMKGDKNRRIGETNMNERSSRSHTIFRIILESRTTDDEDGAVKVSHLNLVDLAGSERSGQSGATGDRFKEGCHINMSLTTLGIVINQLSDVQEGGSQFINFRDSKLTRLLQSSLGGNAMTVIVCAVTPAAEDQTQNTLSFASRAKRINNKPILNEVLSESALIKRYLKQIARLNQELEVIKQKSGMSEVEEISNKLKEKEEINKVLNERISRLKEALIVSSSSPARKKQKIMPREKRRHSWCGLPAGGGGGSGRMSFKGNSYTLTTIAEQSPSSHAISPPQANSTRLDETMCPFEKFELELMRDRNRDCSDMIEDTRESILEEQTITDTAAGTTSNYDKSIDLTLVGHRRATNSPQIEGTPPFILRQRINNMSTFVEDVVKEYDELREFTTLEKQFHTEEINHIIEGLKQNNKSLKSKLATTEVELKLSEEKRLQTEVKLEAAEDKITSLENELFTYKESLLEMEDKLLKNLDTNLLKELAELKEVNARIEDELKLKAEDFQKLKEQADEVNTNFVNVTAEKDKLQADIRGLIKKVKELETVNSDLEVTLDHKNRKSIERETELENELKAAWQVLESREKIMRRDLIEKECLQLKKITLEEPVDTNSTSVQDEMDRTVIADPNDVIVESTEKNNVDTTLNNTVDLNATGEATDRINFVSCDATLSNISILSPTELSDPLKSFCLSESMIPVEIQAEEDTVSQFNTSAVENQMLIQDLCEILGDKNELKEKIFEMKSEAANIQKEYEDKKNDLMKMAEEIASYEEFLSNVKEALNLEGDQKSFDDIKKEINNLKQSKDMEGGLLEKVEKLESFITNCHSVLKGECSEAGQDMKEKSLTILDSLHNAKHLELQVEQLRKEASSLIEHKEVLEKVLKILSANSNATFSLENILDEMAKYKAEFVDMQVEIDQLQDCRKRISELENQIQENEMKNNGFVEAFKRIQGELDLAEDITVESLPQLIIEMKNQALTSSDVSQKLVEFVSNCYSALNVCCEPSSENVDDKLASIVARIHELKLDIEKANGENISLKQHKSVLEELFQILSEGNDSALSIENVIQVLTLYKKEFNEMQNQLEELGGCKSELEKQVLESEIKHKCFADVFEKIQAEFIDEDVTIESLPERIMQMKNQALTSSNVSQKLEEFVSNCYSSLNVSCEPSSENVDDKLASIVARIHKLELDIEKANGENMSLKQHKSVLEELFQILSEGNDSVLSIENVIQVLTLYKKEFNEMQNQLEELVGRKSELEKQVLENEIKHKCFADVFEKIQAELIDEDVTIESLPKRIIQMKNQALTSSDVSQKLEEFVSNCYSSLNVSCEPSSENVDDKLASIVARIHELELDIEKANGENMSLKQHKSVLEELFQILSEGNDSALSIENVIQVLTLYKKDFNEMQNQLEELVGRKSELEKQVLENEIKHKCFADVFEKIQAKLIDEDVTIESLPERIIQMKNQALTSSDVSQKLEEFVSNCYSALNVYCEPSSENVDDKLASIVARIHELKLDIEKANGENMSLKQHKSVLEELFQILSEGNDNALSIENVIQVLTLYKKEFNEMQNQLEELGGRKSELEKQVLESEIKHKCFADVFEKIQAEFIDEDVTIESLPERIIQMKNQALTSSNVSQKLTEFVNSCHSALNVECDALSEDVDEGLSSILGSIQKLAALKLESDTVSDENAILVKHKEVLEKLFEILSENTDAVISVENIIDEITKYKKEFVEMAEKIEKIDEYVACISEMADIKKKHNTFVQVFENISREFEDIGGDFDIEMLPEVIIKMRNELNEFNKFKFDVNSIVRNLSGNESDVGFTTEELVSAIKDSEKKIVSLNEKLHSVQEENGRLTEISSRFDMKLKEYLSIESIISLLGTDLGSGMQSQIEDIQERRIQSPELSKQIEKLVEFNRAYLELENKLCKTFTDMKVFENSFRNIQCILGAADLDNIENYVKDLKNEANELAAYKSMINEISGHLSSEHQSDMSSENILSSIVDLKNQISAMTEKMETLEAWNIKVSETVEDLDNKMKYVTDMEQVISSVCSVLEVSSREDVVFAIEDLKKNFVDLKNDVGKIVRDKDSYLQTIQCLFRKISGDVEANNLPCDEELKDSVISKADSMKNEISRLKELLNGIKQLLSDLSQVDLRVDDEIKLEDVKNSIEDIKKNLCEVYELKMENMSRKTEVETMKEKMQAHFECVDIVFNLCQLLSENVGKTIAKCDILNIVDSLIQKGVIPLNESLVVDMEESGVKVSETDALRKELDDLNVYFSSLMKIFDAEGLKSRDNLLQFVNNVKNDHESLVSKYNSLQSECVIYRDSVTEVIKSVCKNISDDIGCEEKCKLLTQRIHTLVEVENRHCETLSHNQLLTNFQNSISDQLGLTNSTLESTVEALKMLKSELEKNQINVDELKIQLEDLTNEKVDLKEKIDDIVSIIRESDSTRIHDEQKSSAFDFCKSELLKMIKDYNNYVHFYNDLCACLSDRVEELSKDTLCGAVAAIKEENNSLHRTLQDLSADNEKIISDLNSAYESVKSKLDLTKKENEKVMEELKVLVSADTGTMEVDLVQSVADLIDGKSKMNARVQELVSEISMMKSSITEKLEVHCELEQCQSLLRAIKVELDLSDGDSHNALLDTINNLKSKSDQAEEELVSVTDELRKCVEYLNLELSKITGNVEKEDHYIENMQLLCSKSLLEQLKSDSTDFVNLCRSNESLVDNLRSEIDKQSATVKSLESANNEREALLQRIQVELEIQNESNESVCDSIKMLKDNLQQLRNENTSVKTTNEELGKTAESLKLELDESTKNEELLKSEKDSLNMQVRDNLVTIEQLKLESANLNEKLTDSLSSIARKDETIGGMETRIQELQTNIESNEKLIESLKNEVAEQRKVIEDLRNEMKRIEVSAKVSENQSEVKTKIEETLKELNRVQQKLDDFIAVDKTLKKKLVTEIKNMNSDFKPGSDEVTSVQLLDSFVSVVMEKYKEVVMTLNQNFETDKKKLKEKINQLESKEKKTKEWIEQLEAEAESTNQDMNAKSTEIDRLLEIVQKKENELKNKSEDLDNIKEHLKTSEAELNSLRAENKEIIDKMKDHLSEQTHSMSDSLKLKENLEKTIEERDALSIEVNNTRMNISQLQSTFDSQQQALKGYFNKFNEQQAQLGEKDTIISNLKDKNEACLQDIEDLKQELRTEKDECDRLSSSLNTMKAEYSNVQQSLETNKKATEVLEGKLDEFFRDMNDTKAMAANLVESLKKDEQIERAERKALQKINEEKTIQCNDLKTKLYLLEMEISKYNSTQGETVSKMKEEVDAVNKINKELRDDILEKARTIDIKQKECQRLENEVSDLRQKFEKYSRTLSLLQNDVLRKDQELTKLEKLKEEAIKLEDCLKDKDMKCADFSSRNSLLEKDLVDRSNQITKLQLALEKYEKELQDVRASSEKLEEIKIQLKNKEDACNAVSNTASLLEKQIAESEKIITKLKSDIICKDEDLSKMKNEINRLSSSLEEATKSELKHQPKKLKLNKFENFSNEKENDMCLKLNTSHNTQQQIGCQKCKTLEKELSVLFKVPVEGDVVDKMKQSLVKLEEFENKHNQLQTDYKELDAECEDLNAQIKSLEAECTNLVYKIDEMTKSCDKVKEEYEKELTTGVELKKKNENLTKDLDACRVELERCHEMVRSARRERGAALQRSFRESDRRQPLDLSASEVPTPITPNAGDFKSIKHRWEQLSTSSQKHQPTPSRECQCEELTKQNQELKLELADKTNKVTLLEIQIQGQNFPYKKKAAALEEALNEAKTKIMTLKQEVRRLQTCLHDVSVFQSCETCRNKAKTVTTETSVQTMVTDTEASVSGSEIIQRQSLNLLKEKTAKLERENMLLKRLCRDRNRKIEVLEHDLKSGGGPKT